MTDEQAKKLREPFPPEAIGKLPKGGVMLDFVGHAAATDRLLQVDPDWTWEPMAVGPNGEPLIVNGGLWIKLTVCGVTRPGWGDGKDVKEMISDAIRNAAMRFGVALDLWSKQDLHADGEQPAKPASAKPAAAKPAPAAAQQKTPGDAVATEVEQKKLTRLAANLNQVQPLDWDKIIAQFALEQFGCERSELTIAQVLAIAKELPKQLDALDKAKLRDLQAAA